jgi:hypothetical protein
MPRVAGGLLIVLTSGLVLVGSVLALNPRVPKQDAVVSATATPQDQIEATISGGPLLGIENGSIVFLDIYHRVGAIERTVPIGPTTVERPDGHVVTKDRDVSRLRVGDFVQVSYDAGGFATHIAANGGWLLPGSRAPS